MTLIKSAVPTLFLWAISLVFLTGHGTAMIPGYNFMPEEAREKYDEKALCRSISLLLFLAGIFVGGIFVGSYLGNRWLTLGGFGACTVLCIGFTFYATSGNRFLK